MKSFLFSLILTMFVGFSGSAAEVVPNTAQLEVTASRASDILESSVEAMAFEAGLATSFSAIEAAGPGGCSAPNGRGGFITVTWDGNGGGFVAVYNAWGSLLDAWSTSEWAARAMCNQNKK